MRLSPNQGYCLKLHCFNFHPLLEAGPQVKGRSSREGEYRNPLCQQEFQTLSWERGLKGTWGHGVPEGDTTTNCTYFPTLETQPWVQPSWVPIPALILPNHVTTSK